MIRERRAFKAEPNLEWFRVNSIISPGGCWIWQGHKTAKGYGQFCLRYKVLRTHRFALQLVIGKIDPTLEVDHLCRNRGCCNPEHLEAVTPAENRRRAGIRSHEGGRCWRCGSSDLRVEGHRLRCRPCKCAYDANRNASKRAIHRFKEAA